MMVVMKTYISRIDPHKAMSSCLHVRNAPHEQHCGIWKMNDGKYTGFVVFRVGVFISENVRIDFDSL